MVRGCCRCRTRATAAGAGEAAVPTDRPLDGVNLIPFVTGKTAGDPHRTLYWRSGRYRVLLSGGWKLQTLEDPKKVWLYDLANDPTEQHNLAQARPDKVRELAGLLGSQDAQMVKPIWPSLVQGPISIDHPLSVPDKPGDEYIVWDN